MIIETDKYQVVGPEVNTGGNRDILWLEPGTIHLFRRTEAEEGSVVAGCSA